MDRRKFVAWSAVGASGLVLPSWGHVQQPTATTTQDKPRPPQLAAEKVKEFVIAGHFDLDKVKALLVETPSLLNASWDWGAGDWEMAIGGAGHMGRKDIASYLISQGSRYDIFVAAMLGKLEIVRAALTANPELANSKGPHGIPLMAHAKKGGDDAAAVVKYLEGLG